jgi:surface antigen
MRTSSSIVAMSLNAFGGFFLAATVLMSSDPGFAQNVRREFGAVELPPPSADNNVAPPESGACSCSNGGQPSGSNSGKIDQEQREKLWPRPSLAELKSTLDDTDAVAALEAVQLALTEVGDGATYVWHRKHGRLSGAIQPTTSFKDGSGHICRHIVMALTSGNYSRKAEGIACRQRDGVWVLEG